MVKSGCCADRPGDHQPAQQRAHAGHLFWQAEAEPAQLSREPEHLGLQLVQLCWFPQSLSRALVPSLALVDLTRGHWVTQCASVDEKGLPPLFQYSTCLVWLYHSRDNDSWISCWMLILGFFISCLLPAASLSRPRLNAVGSRSSGTACIFMLLLNFFIQGRWKDMFLAWEEFRDI